jgi:glycosyltransferase involved in cell wall biosynthesis
MGHILNSQGSNTEPGILLVAYWFPPAGGIAVQRALSLAQYLPQEGFRVHVLTPRNPPAPSLDPTLLTRISEDVKVHRVWTPMPGAALRKRLWRLFSRGAPRPVAAAAGTGSRANFISKLLFPDPEVVWTPFAIRRARRIVKEHAIKTVLVTAPPFSAFLVGNALKREFPGLQLISDFRDEWLRFFLSTFEFQQSGGFRRRAEKMERTTIERSDLVITVTPSLVEELRNRYPAEAAPKFTCIPNGYDPAAFASFVPRNHQSSKIVVTYVGTVYSATSPGCYFDGLDALPASLRSRIETRFVGRITEDQRTLLESRKNVQILGFVPQHEALRCMEETDYLLLTMKDPTAVTGKIYEYLATGKPILAFSPQDGEVARTLAETGAGWCLDPRNSRGIRACLEAVATGELKTGFHPNPVAVRRYERPSLIAEFAKAIREAGTPVPTLVRATSSSIVSRNN